MTLSPLGRLREQLEEKVLDMRAEIRRIAVDFDVYTVPSLTVSMWLNELSLLLRVAAEDEQTEEKNDLTRVDGVPSEPSLGSTASGNKQESPS